MPQHRTERISEALREELTELIGYELSDPRVASATVTGIEVSPDKRHALVRIRVDDGDGCQAGHGGAWNTPQHSCAVKWPGAWSFFESRSCISRPISPPNSVAAWTTCLNASKRAVLANRPDSAC